MARQRLELGTLRNGTFTPLLWRKEEAKQLAPARVVKVPPRDKPLD